MTIVFPRSLSMVQIASNRVKPVNRLLTLFTCFVCACVGEWGSGVQYRVYRCHPTHSQQIEYIELIGREKVEEPTTHTHAHVRACAYIHTRIYIRRHSHTILSNNPNVPKCQVTYMCWEWPMVPKTPSNSCQS